MRAVRFPIHFSQATSAQLRKSRPGGSTGAIFRKRTRLLRIYLYDALDPCVLEKRSARMRHSKNLKKMLFDPINPRKACFQDGMVPASTQRSHAFFGSACALCEFGGNGTAKTRFPRIYRVESYFFKFFPMTHACCENVWRKCAGHPRAATDMPSGGSNWAIFRKRTRILRIFSYYALDPCVFRTRRARMRREKNSKKIPFESINTRNARFQDGIV
jgi:hypothetical protein